ATTEIYPLSLHDALPICRRPRRPVRAGPGGPGPEGTPTWRSAPQLLQLISSKPGPHLVIREDGSVFAKEIRPVLAVAAEADAALHVAFQRQIDVAGRHTARLQLPDYVAHHDLRPADHGHGVKRLQSHQAEQAGHHTHVAAPA